MSTLTLRLSEEQSRLLARTRELTAHKANTKAIMAALEDYVKVVELYRAQRECLDYVERELYHVIQYKPLTQTEGSIQEVRERVRETLDKINLVDW